MALSVFDLFRVGIGPSSSHTVGPLRAGRLFVLRLEKEGLLAAASRVTCRLYGSLGATGRGHATDRAVVWGLAGEAPETVDPTGTPSLPFAFELFFCPETTLEYHPNALTFEAWGADGRSLAHRTFYSVGGGFIVDEAAARAGFTPPESADLPFPFGTAAELLAHVGRQGLPVSAVVLANEAVFRPEAEVRSGLLALWHTMEACAARGLVHEGVLPGGFDVPRRAPAWHRRLLADRAQAGPLDPLEALDWVQLWALAVGEENAGGGRVVTAPTNGAAAIIPAVLHYYTRFCGGTDDGVARFLLTAGAIGLLFKQNGSISGAEVGCQGEVGVACSMAAAGLTEAWGGTPAQVENAAEIGMEHNLGLTCDPIGGLVQIPCIERNALAAVKAITVARMALRGDGRHRVSLDQVIRTMLATGRDMSAKYKETSRGGLAVNLTEC